MESLQYLPYQTTTFQFLSVCHYITSFGKIFYNLNFIHPEYQNYSVPVLNSLFQYIQLSTNESEAKRQLIREVLKGSDLYGGEENETLDMKYINETFQYIISSSLFAHYGNIHGYLAKIISQASNITHFALKKTVLQNLSKINISRDYCSSSEVNYQLTNLTIQRVFNEHVWSMFPEPKHNMKIMDINYLYAMIGLKIIRSIPGDAKNVSFENYTLLAKLIDFQILTNETFQVAVELYSTPALFHYAYKQTDEFHFRGIYDEKFLQMIIISFIKFLKNSNKRICNNEFKESKLSEFNNGLLNFARTHAAEFRNEFLNKTLDLLREVELNSLQQLLDDGNITQKFKFNATVKFFSIFHQSRNCSKCIPTGGMFIVFSLSQNERIDFYTIRQDGNTLTLLANITREQIFTSKSWSDIYARENYPNYSRDVHKSYRNSTILQKVIAEIFSLMQAEIFLSSANVSKAERIKIAKSFPPFYTCLEVGKSDNFTEIATICKPVFKSLLPIPQVGENIILSTVWKHKFTEIGEQILKNISKSEINYERILHNVNVMYRKINKYFLLSNKVIFTIASRQIFKPGFELSLQITNSCRKILEAITQELDSRFSIYRNKKNLLSTMKSAIYLLDTYLNQNQKGQIFRYRYPGGGNYFGPLCTFSFGRIAEFRSVDKIQYKVPVILDLNSDGENYYRLYNPKTGEVSKIIFKLQKNNILQLQGLYSDEDFLKIIDLSTAYAN